MHATKLYNGNVLPDGTVVDDDVMDRICGGVTSPAFALLTFSMSAEEAREKRAACNKPESLIEQLNAETGAVINRWPTQAAAASGMGIHQAGISQACNGSRATEGGFRWRIVNAPAPSAAPTPAPSPAPAPELAPAGGDASLVSDEGAPAVYPRPRFRRRVVESDDSDDNADDAVTAPAPAPAPSAAPAPAPSPAPAPAPAVGTDYASADSSDDEWFV